MNGWEIEASPLEQAQLLAPCVDVRHVEVIVLHGFGQPVLCELAGKLREAAGKPSQAIDFFALERQIMPEHVLVARGQRFEP
jgi:hypothetical protein